MKNNIASVSPMQSFAGTPDSPASTVLQLPRTVQRMTALRRALQPAKRIRTDHDIERHLHALERAVHRAVTCVVLNTHVHPCPSCGWPVTRLQLCDHAKTVLCDAVEDFDLPVHQYGHWQSNYFAQHDCDAVRS